MKPHAPLSPSALPDINPALLTRIAASDEQGELLALIEEHFGLKEAEAVHRVNIACAGMHNDGKIDLLKLAASEAFSALPAHRFFSVQPFFVDAIPSLDIPVPAMLTLVSALVKAGGEDLAASLPNGSLLKWLQRDAGRAEVVISMAASGDPLALDHLTFALEAVSDVERTQELARTTEGLARLSALTALSRLKHTVGQANATHSLVAELLHTETDDGRRSRGLAAAFAALASASPDAAIDLPDLVEAAASRKEPHTQHECAHILWRHAARMNDATRDALIGALVVIAPQYKGIVQTFDVALSALFDISPKAAVDACARFLSEPNNEHALEELSSFGAGLVTSPLFGQTALDWLASGEHALCDGLHDLLQKRDRASSPLLLPSTNGLDDDLAFFISCKAIGYFFTQPVVAASVIIALLRGRGSGGTKALENFLVDPLLSNYGGELREYLDTVGPEDPAHAHVQNALARADGYVEGLKSVPRIPELLPSERERQIERIRSADEMSRMFKAARKESIFYNLVSRSVVLHGRRTISYIRRGNEPLQPFDMDLGSHGVSFELPRTEAVDPISLDVMLLRCRSLKREAV